MKSGKNIVSKRTFALACVAVILFTFGGVMGVRAARNAPDIMSQDLEADFKLQHIGVHLYENGEWAGKRTGALTGSGLVLSDMYENASDDEGTFIPGKKYKEEIAAQNSTDVEQYVRIIIHKYWLSEDASGNLVKDTSPSLDPDLIKLSYGNGDYNDADWVRNDREHTRESDTYYYRTALEGGDMSELLTDKIAVSSEILDGIKYVEQKENGKTVITYVYDYDGKHVGLEADVQSVQTHNANDAIKGIWGVQNVTVSGDRLNVN